MAAIVVRSRAGKFVQTFAHFSKRRNVLVQYPASSQGYIALCVTSWQPRRGVTFSFGGKKEQHTEKEKELVPLEEEDEFREHFIPITRRSVIRHLMQQKDFLTEEEKKKFEGFSLALDSAIVNRYHGFLQELKSLFDPINPDKDTIATRTWNRRERLDNEFWLVQKLGSVMEKANFHELPKPVVDRALAEHSAREGVLVSVNPDKYDVLKFWALGKEIPEVPLTLQERIMNMIMRRSPPKPVEYYKRVVVAVRLRKDDKLLLKAFKEVPMPDLGKLLPDGTVKMSKLDNRILTTSLAIAGTGVMAKIVTMLAKVHVDWTLLVTGVTGLIGVQAWTTYKNRHLAYINDLSRMLYFKNIANNRGLLTLLVDRAEDELFKETLLMYTFLLTNRPPSAKDKDSEDLTPDELGAIPASQLERRIEEWVKEKTGHKIEYDSSEASRLLKEFGILSEDYEYNLHVLPIDAAMHNLPQTPQSITARVDESDIVEGYDRDVTDEKEEEYEEEDKKRKMFGWF